MFADKKRKKRKAEDSEQTYEDAKHKKQDEFTEIEFKFLLRNSNTVFSGFERFIDEAEKWPMETQCDIVECFLRSSPECAEIFQVLEDGRRKVQELQLIFQCLEKLLLRIAGDLDKYYTTGQHVVKKLLSTQLKAIYFTLNARHKSSQIKSALKLLVAMVMLGPTAGKTVLGHIDLNHANIRPLFTRRDAKAKEDVRTCLLHLAVAFLLAGDNELIRKLADTKGFLPNIFQGINFDRVSTIQLMLSTLLEKIILNPVISKTSKVHIFNENSLKLLGQLYHWKGPAKWKEKGLEKGREDVEEEADAMVTEDQQIVMETVHKFLCELCSSYKFGINFFDKAYGTSTRNQNRILTSFLTYLRTISQGALVQELITKILVASPDQLRHFLPQMAASLSPRATTKWVDTVKFLCKIYEAQPDKPHVLMSKESISVNQVVNILLVYTLPPLQVLNAVLPGIKNKSIAVSHISLSVVKVIAQKCVNILRGLNHTDCTLRNILSKEQMAELVTTFKDTVTKNLPESVEIFQCLDRLKMGGKKEEMTQQLLELAELCQALPSDYMMKIEQVLCFYQDLNPSLLLDHPIGLVKLLEGIGSQNEATDLTQNEAERVATQNNLLPQLYLLKLLSGTDARRLPWAKEGHSGHSLMYQLLGMVTQDQQTSGIKEISLHLMCNLLASTGVFDTFSDEMYIWIKHLQAQVSSNENSSDLLTFVSKILTMYIANPYPYMDRVSDLMSEAVGLESGATTVDSNRQKLEKKMEEIMSMDLDCLEDEEDTASVFYMVAKRHAFCPLLLVAVDHVQKLETDISDIKQYLSLVILDVFHCQTDPKALCLLMKQSPETLLVDGLQIYTRCWLPPYKVRKPKKQLLTITDQVQGHLMQYLCGSEPDLTQLQEVSEYDVTLTLRQCLLYVRLMLEKDRKEDNSSALNHILEFITRMLTPESDGFQPDSGTIIDDKTQLPVEFVELEVKKPSRKEELESLYKILLQHQSIRFWFLSGLDDPTAGGKDKASSIVISEFMEILLGYIKSVGLGENLKEDLNFYVDRVLKFMNQGTHYASKYTSLVMKLLLHLLDYLDIDKTHDVLSTVLDTDKENLAGNDSIVGIVMKLVANLTAQDRLTLKLSGKCIQNLVSLTSKTANSDLMDGVMGLMKKFPNLSVLCSEQNLIELLKNLTDTRLAEILVSNSVELRRCIGSWFKKCGKWDEWRKQLMPLVLTFLHCQQDTTAVTSYLEGVYLPAIANLCQNDLSDDMEAQGLVEILRQFLRIKAIGKTSLKALEKSLNAMLESGKALKGSHVKVFQMILGCQETDGESHDFESRGKLWRFCIQGLAKVVKNKENRDLDVARKILEVLYTYAEEEVQGLCSQWDDFTELWPFLLKGCLKYLYLDARALKFLSCVLPSLQEKSEDVSISIDTIVTMVMSHSSFLTVMFNEESSESKEPLLDLVTQLITLSPSSCVKDHIGIYLGSYGATLSMSDQKLLKLMHLYEKNGTDLSDFRPFLWGEKAIENHTMRTSMGPSLLKQPTMSQILSGLDSSRMANTINSFPLRRQLQCLEPQEAAEYKSQSDCYDPCFFIPLFSHLLAPAALVDCRKFIEKDCLGVMLAALSSHDPSMRSAAYHIIERFEKSCSGTIVRFSDNSTALVDCRKFIEKDCLGVMLAALSSHDPSMRSAAYHIIERFYFHLEGARFLEVEQIQYILELLKNSVAASRSKLACIVTVFLARAVRIMLKADDHMYGLINGFLLLKPSLDVVNVPEFYKLFNSSAMEYKIERQWILSLLLDGLRETADYRIFEKRYTFKLLQSYYDSNLSDIPTQIKVLQILHSACKERTVVIDLIRYHGYLTWLSGTVQNIKPSMVEHISYIINILNSLWFTLLGNKKYQGKGSKPDDDKGEITDSIDNEAESKKDESLKEKIDVPPTVTSQVLMVHQALLWKMRDVEELTFKTFIDTVLSLMEHRQLTVAGLEEAKEPVILSELSVIDILLLLIHSETIIPSQKSSRILLDILTGMGYDESILVKGKNATLRRTFKKKVVEENSVSETENWKTGKSKIETQNDGNDRTNRTVETNLEDSEIDKEGKIAINQDTEKDSTKKSCLRNLVKIITSHRNQPDDNPAHIIAIISWCLEQSGHIEDINILGALTAWIYSCTEVNELIIQTVASSIDVSSDIIGRLLNLYIIVSEMKVTGAADDCIVHEDVIKDVNAVLEKVAIAKLKILEESAGKNYTKLRKCLGTGNKMSFEVKSSMLRRFFLSTDEDKNILPDDDNEELMVHESSPKIITQTVKSGTRKTTPKSARKAEMKPHSLKSIPKKSPKTVGKSGVEKSNQQKSTPKNTLQSPVDSNSELSPLTKNKKRLSTPLTNRKLESKKEMLKVNRSLKRTKSKQTL